MYACVIDGNPAFTSQAQDAIKRKAEDFNNAGEELVLALMFDEMAIKKKLELVGDEIVGHVNWGDEQLTSVDVTPLATEALVFMVVSVNDGRKLPACRLLFYRVFEIRAKH
ncbi:hypothetical protein FOCC_FOCC001965 [Frankliniella occidentalis]|nr:hypothetical protein FOCC_FOCC001965 [Frankliniella occidentalis]